MFVPYIQIIANAIFTTRSHDRHLLQSSEIICCLTASTTCYYADQIHRPSNTPISDSCSLISGQNGLFLHYLNQQIRHRPHGSIPLPGELDWQCRWDSGIRTFKTQKKEQKTLSCILVVKLFSLENVFLFWRGFLSLKEIPLDQPSQSFHLREHNISWMPN